MTQTYTVNVTGADDAPTLGAVTSGSVAEVDQSSSTTDRGLTGTLAGADVDVETLTYGIQGGTVALVSRPWWDLRHADGGHRTGAVQLCRRTRRRSRRWTTTGCRNRTATCSRLRLPTAMGAVDADLHGERDGCGRCADAWRGDLWLDCGSRSELEHDSTAGLTGTLAGADVDVETLTYGIQGGTVAAGVATPVGPTAR